MERGKDKPIRHLKDGQTGEVGGSKKEDLQINVITCPAVIRWRPLQKKLNAVLSKHQI